MGTSQQVRRAEKSRAPEREERQRGEGRPLCMQGRCPFPSPHRQACCPYWWACGPFWKTGHTFVGVVTTQALSGPESGTGAACCFAGSSEVVPAGNLCGGNQVLPSHGAELGGVCPPGMCPLSTWRARRVKANTKLRGSWASSMTPFVLVPGASSSASSHDTGRWPW